MGLRGKMEAMARGEVSTSALEAYGTSNNDAYDLLERVSPEGPAQLAAWCAFVCHGCLSLRFPLLGHAAR